MSDVTNSENILAYSIKQKEINYDENDLLLIQAQLVNRNSDGKVMVEKVSPDNSYYGGKYHIPGIAVRFGEHPEEAPDLISHSETLYRARNNCFYEHFDFGPKSLSTPFR